MAQWIKCLYKLKDLSSSLQVASKGLQGSEYLLPQCFCGERWRLVSPQKLAG